MKPVIDHVERAERAWPHLVRRARSGNRPYTYGEISALIDVHHRAARYFLGVIQRYCDSDPGRPALQALVVNKDTGRPGRGYHGSSRSKKAHERELERVRAYHWRMSPPNLRPFARVPGGGGC